MSSSGIDTPVMLLIRNSDRPSPDQGSNMLLETDCIMGDTGRRTDNNRQIKKSVSASCWVTTSFLRPSFTGRSPVEGSVGLALDFQQLAVRDGLEVGDVQVGLVHSLLGAVLSKRTKRR